MSILTFLKECPAQFMTVLKSGKYIEVAAWYISTQYPNNKPANQRKNNNEKGDDPKSEDKDNITGDTTRAHVEDTTINEDTAAPSGGADLGAHVSETSQAISCPSDMVEEILGVNPIDDTF